MQTWELSGNDAVRDLLGGVFGRYEGKKRRSCPCPWEDYDLMGQMRPVWQEDQAKTWTQPLCLASWEITKAWQEFLILLSWEKAEKQKVGGFFGIWRKSFLRTSFFKSKGGKARWGRAVGLSRTWTGPEGKGSAVGGDVGLFPDTEGEAWELEAEFWELLPPGRLCRISLFFFS